jgi:flagellar capping protein FliD
MALRRRIGGVFVEFQPMSPDDMQRTMQILQQQQAQFAADSVDSQARFDAQFDKLSGKVDLVAEGLIGLTAIVGRVVDSVGEIAEAQKRTDEQQKRTDEQLRATDARLSEHISTVEAHLNVVIEMFERHLREDHGQRPS